MRIRIGIRPSQLALIQAKEVISTLSTVRQDIDPVFLTISTHGDRDKQTPLALFATAGLFTLDIELALIDGKIDMAVHSAKDVEEKIPAGLKIAALTPSISSYECLVSTGQHSLATLPAGSRVGTSSQARKNSLLAYRPDLEVLDIRGNVDDRLRQLDSGKYDAVIVAHAALIRLGLEPRASQIIATEIMPPHPLQGRLAVQIHEDNIALNEMIRKAYNAKA